MTAQRQHWDCLALRYFFIRRSPLTSAVPRFDLLFLAAARELARSNNKTMDLQIQQEGQEAAFFAARSLISTDRHSGRVVRKESGLVSPAVSAHSMSTLH